MSATLSLAEVVLAVGHEILVRLTFSRFFANLWGLLVLRMFPPGGNKHQVEPQSPVGAAAKLAGERVRRNRDGGTVMGDGRHDLHDLHDPLKMHFLWIHVLL